MAQLNQGKKTDEAQILDINRFSYYSGSQITVWFGDILIDDISSIQWSRSQGKKPIYGYASQQFDAVANGTVIIQGNFTINFRQSGYLSMVMSEISKLYSTWNLTNWNVIKEVVGLHLKNGTFGPQTAQEIKDLGNSENFLDQVKLYERTIWGDGLPVQADAWPEDRISGDQKASSNYNMAPDVAQPHYAKDGFNILITYGSAAGNEPRTLNDYFQSTTKSLVGVHLMGDSQIVQVGGQAVMEQYDFIARGTDEYLGTTR